MTTAQLLTGQDVEALTCYARGEHVRDIALRLGVDADLLGLRLANLCALCRDRAHHLATAARGST